MGAGSKFAGAGIRKFISKSPVRPGFNEGYDQQVFAGRSREELVMRARSSLHGCRGFPAHFTGKEIFTLGGHAYHIQPCGEHLVHHIDSITGIFRPVQMARICRMDRVQAKVGTRGASVARCAIACLPGEEQTSLDAFVLESSICQPAPYAEGWCWFAGRHHRGRGKHGCVDGG